MVANASWVHPNFTAEYLDTGDGDHGGYKQLAWGGKDDNKHENYARDWDVNAIMWGVHNYDFKYVVNVDDDALMCTQNVLHQLSLLPSRLSSFVFGYSRWDAFDNW